MKTNNWTLFPHVALVTICGAVGAYLYKDGELTWELAFATFGAWFLVCVVGFFVAKHFDNARHETWKDGVRFTNRGGRD